MFSTLTLVSAVSVVAVVAVVGGIKTAAIIKEVAGSNLTQCILDEMHCC